MENELFKDFKSVGADEWMSALLKELKGKSFEETLVWNTIEGIRLEPFYDQLKKNVGVPGTAPYRRGISKPFNAWEIDFKVDYQADDHSANKEALQALSDGASSITFSGDLSSVDLNQLLNGIELPYVEIRFEHSGKNKATLIHKLKEYYTGDPALLRAGIYSDPIGEALLAGGFEQDFKSAFSSHVLSRGSEFPLMHSITVDAGIYHNAGANTVQELAFALAHGYEYLHMMLNAGIKLEDAVTHIEFRFANGPDFYMTLCKYRAFRQLWATIVKAHQPKHACILLPYTFGLSSDLYRSDYDRYTNLLRFTTEVFAAASGSCNAYRVEAFDRSVDADKHFALRIGKNIQLVLQEESHVGRVTDPAGGSYYFEHLTDELVNASWSLFQQLEKDGGFISSIEKGKIQNEIKSSAEKLKLLFESGKLKMIGVNVFPNKQEKTATLPKAQSSGTLNQFDSVQLLRLSDLIKKEMA